MGKFLKMPNKGYPLHEKAPGDPGAVTNFKTTFDYELNY